MSERQISQQMRQSLRSAKNFIKTEKTAVESVRLPNNQTINALPLTSVAEYWEYLVQENLIPKKIPYEVDWQELIQFLKEPGRSQEGDSKVSEEYYSAAKKAQKLLIHLETIHLEILILPDDEYRISYESGLELIDELSTWLEHLEESSNRKIILQSKGFTGTVQVCKIKDKGVNKLVKALDLDDWIKVWEYFAKQGNKKAVSVLAACAKENLKTRIAEALQSEFSHSVA